MPRGTGKTTAAGLAVTVIFTALGIAVLIPVVVTVPVYLAYKIFRAFDKEVWGPQQTEGGGVDVDAGVVRSISIPSHTRSNASANAYARRRDESVYHSGVGIGTTSSCLDVAENEN